MLTKTAPPSSLNFQKTILMSEANKPISIFLLDDHRLFNQVVKSMLDQVSGFEVIGQAYTLKEGITKVSVTRPEILLLDYHLPDGNGLEAAATVLKKLPKTKIIFLTMEQDQQVMESVIQTGAMGYLLKETGREELLNALSAVLEGRTIISGNLRKKQIHFSNTKINNLSKREKEIALLIINGLQTIQIADQLNISEHTVTTHRKNIMRKLGAHNSIQLAKMIQ